MPARINLFGGPGVGKSQTAAKLYAALVEQGLAVELVTEEIKDAVWEGADRGDFSQWYTFGAQMHRERIVLRKGRSIVTDSPLWLSPVYARYYGFPAFVPPLVEVCRQFDNAYPALSIVLERTVPYEPTGRYQDETGAREIDAVILALLRQYRPHYLFYDPRTQFPRIVAVAAAFLAYHRDLAPSGAD